MFNLFVLPTTARGSVREDRVRPPVDTPKDTQRWGTVRDRRTQRRPVSSVTLYRSLNFEGSCWESVTPYLPPLICGVVGVGRKVVGVLHRTCQK